MKGLFGITQHKMREANVRAQNLAAAASSEVVNNFKKKKEELSTRNSELSDRNVDFDNLSGHLSVLETNENSSFALGLEANNYLHQTEIARQQINPENYYYWVTREEKIKTKVLCVNGYPKYRYVQERHFNQRGFDQDTSNAENKINQATEVNQKIIQEQEKAQAIFNRAAEQVQNKIDELNTQNARILQQADATRQQLFNAYYSNSMLMEELRITSQQLENIKNEEKKLQHMITTLPSIIAASDKIAQQNTELDKTISKKMNEAFLELKRKEQEEIDFIDELEESSRTEYFAYIYTLKQNLDLDARKQYELMQRKLNIAECKTIDYEYLAFIAIQECNTDLLAYALKQNVDCEQAIFNNYNLLQHAIYTENDAIIKLVMNKSEDEDNEYNRFFSQYEISLTIMLEQNDLIGIKKLLEKKGDNLIKTFTEILDNAIQTNNEIVKNNIFKIFPEMQDQLLSNKSTKDYILDEHQEFNENIREQEIEETLIQTMHESINLSDSVHIFGDNSYIYVSNLD